MVYFEHDFRELPISAFSTGALPGSREKLDVMRSRVERGLAVFHPADAGYSKIGPEYQGEYKQLSTDSAIREIVTRELSVS